MDKYGRSVDQQERAVLKVDSSRERARLLREVRQNPAITFVLNAAGVRQ